MSNTFKQSPRTNRSLRSFKENKEHAKERQAPLEGLAPKATGAEALCDTWEKIYAEEGFKEEGWES